MESYLDSTHTTTCHNADCPEAVKVRDEYGRFYITMWHPNFNSRANNGIGYASEQRARAAIRAKVAA